jgi:hypothetical protein
LGVGPTAKRSAWEGQGRKKWWWLRLLVSVGVLGWLLWHTEWSPLVETFARVRWPLCLLALATYCGAQVVSSYRWQLLARSLDFHDKLPRFIGLYFVGMFFNLFLPTSMGGDVVRAWCLAGRGGERWLAALSVFFERFCGLLALLLIACVAALYARSSIPPWAPWVIWGATAVAIVALAELPLLVRWSDKFRSLAEGWSHYRHHRLNWILALVLSVPVQIAGIVQVWLLSQALGLALPLLTLAVVVPLVTLFTLVPISVNGFGIREASLVMLLGPAGVVPSEALALGLLWFCTNAAASLIGGAIYLLGGFARTKVGDTHGPVGGHSDQGRAGQPAAAA